MSEPAVVMTRMSGCERAPMPVCMVSKSSLVLCSWYSSTMAQLGLAPSPGLPMTGSNLLLFSAMDRLETLTMMP